MRVALVQFLYESNTFCGVLGEISLFQQGGAWVEGVDAVREWAESGDSQLRGSLEALEHGGVETLPVLAAVCGSPAGRLSGNCFQQIRGTILSRLREALPFDRLILHFHGAACAEGVDDVEGALMEAIQKELPFLGRMVLSLDLHANVTRRMLTLADGITAYRTMPHRDFYETGQRAARLVLESGTMRTLGVKLHALIPPTDACDLEGPFPEVLLRARELEAEEGVLDVSLFPVQPWIDVRELGCTVVATASVKTIIRQPVLDLAEAWYLQRERWSTHILDWSEIRQRLLGESAFGPWILVDTADATSGGSTGGSVEALRQLIEVQDSLPGKVLLWVVDPEVVRAAENGESRFLIGEPGLSWEARVLSVKDGRFRARGKTYTGQQFSIGRTAVLESGPFQLVVCSQPTLVPDPAFYECMGLDPDGALAVLTKSHLGWIAGFETEGSRGLLFDGPGSTSLKIDRLPLQSAGRHCYPIDTGPSPPFSLWT